MNNNKLLEQQQSPIVVVGSGPVGTRILRDILRAQPDAAVAIYGDESWEPYDRSKLVSLLSGDLAWADLPNLSPLPDRHNAVLNYGNRIETIDRENRAVVDWKGNRQPYSKLVLAIGSNPWLPDIPGVWLPNVHAFRNVGDVRELLDNGYPGRRVVVLGGGLLGVELACGLQRKGEKACLVVSSRLLGRQLDHRAGELLVEHLQALGIEVVFGRATEIAGGRNADGETVAQAVLTFDQRQIDCDCVVLATGVNPTIDLAVKSGLATGRGIKVDDYLRTSDPLIYAAGECAEHRGRVYSLIGPGFEQADVVAQNVLGARVKYHGSAITTQLKGADIAAFSCFQEELDDAAPIRSLSYQSDDQSRYRACA
ncbi:NAD(P)/FAD-dependent oxidoreductase [Methylogaea oryzae]|uniref:NAD(P)/FAD-dependent oxidoreductase n=1 Tax=Methylogaea oryzae TaxID=1295382 RepID=UPI0006D2263F|nr:FAD-dependent oxidoreductase [Methylogaea oryzae]